MIENGKQISRRLFLAKGIAATGSLFVALSGAGALPADAAKKAAKKAIDLAALKSKIKGQVIAASDADFKSAAIGNLWNQLRPDRFPDMVVKVANEQDVVEAVKFARANDIKVAVRGGGHNWCCPSLRNSGMLIDLSNLTQIISIDPDKRKAVVQPIISNRDLQKALNAKGLAYPSGHCPPVKLSGYLLSGGMAWNHGEWGPGVGSVEAIEMVTPDGEMITASKDQNQDYFWAARGGGPGLFAVACRYHLKLYPLPRAIVASVYHYPCEEVNAVASWVESVARKLDPRVEFSLFLVEAPKQLAQKCKSSNNKVLLVTGTAFTNTVEEGRTLLRPLDDCPVLNKCLLKSVNEPTTFEALFDASASLWPGNLRCRVDAIFSDASLTDLYNAKIMDHLLHMPSPKTVYMFAVFTGKNGVSAPPDTAFSMSGKFYGGPWTMWDESKDDASNSAWHEKILKMMATYIKGHYVAETNTVEYPEFAKKAYTVENWKRLAELRKKYDPSGVFFDYSEGLT